MRPKPIVLILMLLLAAAGCVPGNNPIRILGAFPLDQKCSLGSMPPQQGGGLLDASGSLTYIIDLDVESDLAVPTLADPNGMELNNASQNDFIVEALLTSYSMKDNASGATTAIKSDTRPTYNVIATGTTVHVTGNLLGENAVKALLATVTDTSQSETLIVSATLTGHLQSGQKISSDTIVFPINVTRSEVGPGTVDCPTTLANGANATQATGPCGSGGGQDGAQITCL